MELSFGLKGALDLGEAWTVNTAIQPESLDYLVVGRLQLAPDETITFGNNGKLELGDEGNINANSYSIVTSGNLIIFSLQSTVQISRALEAQSLLIDSRTFVIDDQNLIITDNLITTGIDVSALAPIKVIMNFSELGDGFEWPIDENTNSIVSGN